MAIDLSTLDQVHRLLFEILLKPLQGQRFQPTGFPGLGAATFQTADGACLLVESAQSMANRLELMAWDEATQDVTAALQGISHVRIDRPDGSFLTDTIIEAHRLNSPYLLKESSKAFITKLQNDLAVKETGPINRRRLAKVLLKYDIGSLVHGVFLAQPELAGGRLRVARALTAFIEADGVQVAASGGVKNDHVNPSGDTKAGFGNVPFARDEFTAARCTLYVNLDLAQIRGYGLDAPAQRLLVLLALYKLRALVDGGLRLRTSCDLSVITDHITAVAPAGFVLPNLTDITQDLRQAISQCAEHMTVTKTVFADKIEVKKGADDEPEATPEAEQAED